MKLRQSKINPIYYHVDLPGNEMATVRIEVEHRLASVRQTIESHIVQVVNRDHGGCPHLSESGQDARPLGDPMKIWKCDQCGRIRIGDQPKGISR